MPKLHSHTLFHFTNADGLLGILSDNFHPRYMRERYVSPTGPWDYWIPAVCFCDIPLSLIGDHIDEYGEYGIGLSRDWALNSKLNPVLYYHGGSDFFSQFNKMMSSIHIDSSNPTSSEGLQHRTDRLCASSYLFHYYKPYQGYDFKIQKDKWFYDEREWRYVPYIEERAMIIESDADFNPRKEALNEYLKKYVLKFTPADINCLIIKSESQRLEFIKWVTNIKSGYTDDEVKVLVSKIMTVEQIRNDI